MKPIIQAKKLRLGVLASGRGSNFLAIQQAIAAGRLDAEIAVLLSDQPQAAVLAEAQQLGIRNRAVVPGNFNRKEDYEARLVEILQAGDTDIVVLAGYMRLVGSVFLRAFPHRIVNIHPALLPAFTGLHAQRQAVEYGVKYSGCTVHLVDNGMDTGPIIRQTVVPVDDDDDEESLAARILVQEHKIYAEVLQLLAEGRVFLEGRKVWIKQ